MHLYAVYFLINIYNADVEPYKSINSSHTDIPRLRRGMVGGQFWSAYVRCNTQGVDAVERLLDQVSF